MKYLSEILNQASMEEVKEPSILICWVAVIENGSYIFAVNKK